MVASDTTEFPQLTAGNNGRALTMHADGSVGDKVDAERPHLSAACSGRDEGVEYRNEVITDLTGDDQDVVCDEGAGVCNLQHAGATP